MILFGLPTTTWHVGDDDDGDDDDDDDDDDNDDDGGGDDEGGGDVDIGVDYDDGNDGAIEWEKKKGIKLTGDLWHNEHKSIKKEEERMKVWKYEEVFRAPGVHAVLHETGCDVVPVLLSHWSER